MWFLLAVLGFIALLIWANSGLTALLIFIIIVVLLFLSSKIAKAILRKHEREVQRTEAERQKREQEERKEAQKKAQREAQKKWIAYYKTSAFLQQVLKELQISSSQLPEEITIYDDQIKASANGQCRTYSFIAHRVEPLKSVFKAYSGEKFNIEDLFRPQVALAEAINYLLGYEYNIIDMAHRTSDVNHYSDGDTYYSFTYSSNYVILRLKAVHSL